MKKLSGILAIVLAVGAMAFTKANTGNNNTSYYWYYTQADGTIIIPDRAPYFSATDPFCDGGPVKICSKGFNDYDHATYAPLGTAQVIIKKSN
jgi:hypothetical protein